MTRLADLPLLASGKVREMYELGDRLLMVASDRISTYDAVHPTPIPDKGKVLTGPVGLLVRPARRHRPEPPALVHRRRAGRGARARAAPCAACEMLPVECVVRGYITGSGWKDYQATGSVSGIALPAGLQESEQLPEPIFTPEHEGRGRDHDEAIDFDQAAALVGDRALMERVRDVSIALYAAASEHARENGVILADTKFEFGLDGDELVLGDEVLTPDSSRYWPADGLRGRPRPAELRQAVRARLGRRRAAGTRRRRRRRSPTTSSPGTRARYVEAYERITGEPFQSWLDRAAA